MIVILRPRVGLGLGLGIGIVKARARLRVRVRVRPTHCEARQLSGGGVGGVAVDLSGEEGQQQPRVRLADELERVLVRVRVRVRARVRARFRAACGRGWA